MQLNIGCGSDIREGWINVDTYPLTPSVVKADVETGLPFPDEFFDTILASHILEHVIHFDKAWNEIHRVLKTNGTIEIVVPYGYNTDPYHIRFFDLKSIKRLTMYHGHSVICGNENGFSFLLKGKPFLRWEFFTWHLKKYLGIGWHSRDMPIVARIIPIRKNMHFTLQKVS